MFRNPYEHLKMNWSEKQAKRCVHDSVKNFFRKRPQDLSAKRDEDQQKDEFQEGLTKRCTRDNKYKINPKRQRSHATLQETFSSLTLKL